MITLKIHEDDHPEIHKIKWFPCTIGRSMTNDIRLHHGSVSRQHAVVEALEDHFIVRDLETINGLYHRGLRVKEVACKANETLWIGDVKIEVILEENLPKTGPGRSLGATEDQAGLLDTLGVVAVFCCGYIGALLLIFYEAMGKVWPPEAFYPVFGHAFLLWGTGAAIATIFALFSKVNVKQFHLKKIATLVFSFGFIANLVALSMDTIIFNLRSLPGIHYLDIFLFLLLAFGFALNIMHLVLTNVSARVRIIVGTLIACSTVFMVRWVETSKNDSSGRTVMTSLGIPLVDPAIAIDYDSDDMRGFFFRTIAEVDGDRSRILERRGKALASPNFILDDEPSEDIEESPQSE